MKIQGDLQSLFRDTDYNQFNETDLPTSLQVNATTDHLTDLYTDRAHLSPSEDHGYLKLVSRGQKK